MNLTITSTALLETDNYLGIAMVMGRTLPQISVIETTGMNAVGQVSELNWVQSRPGTTGADLDQYQYNYTNDGSVLSRTDVGGNSNGDPSAVQSFVNNAFGYLTSFTNAGNTTGYTVDSMGNRLNPVATTTVTYNGVNESSIEGYVGGNTTTLPIPNNNGASIVYDAWGRVAKIVKTHTVVVTGYEANSYTYTIETLAYQYDAADRQVKIIDTTFGNESAITRVTITTTYFDAANQPVQINTAQSINGSNYTTETQYIWSGADGRIIARETVGSKFVYALTDAEGNVTSLVDYGTLPGQSAPTWQVFERYSYTADGVPTAYNRPIIVVQGGSSDAA